MKNNMTVDQQLRNKARKYKFTFTKQYINRVKFLEDIINFGGDTEFIESCKNELSILKKMKSK